MEIFGFSSIIYLKFTFAVIYISCFYINILWATSSSPLEDREFLLSFLGLVFTQQSGWPRLSWVICGGYSGNEYWPMELAWARGLRDECETYSVAFWMKQLGTVYAREHRLRHPKGEDASEFPADLRMQAFPSTRLR